MRYLFLLSPLAALSFTSCVSTGGSTVQRSQQGTLLSSTPTVAQRKADIASETKGDHFIARRYFVKRTAFWGYVRQPGKSWNTSKLVVLNDSTVSGPDRLPEEGPSHARWGFNQNYEYKLWGYYTGDKVYDPNFNSFLPEFKLQRYELISKEPGWIFSPKDKYNPERVTLRGY